MTMDKLAVAAQGMLLVIGGCIASFAFVHLPDALQISASILSGCGLIAAAIWFRKPVQVHLSGPVTMTTDPSRATQGENTP